jgi:hypothetical protein
LRLACAICLREIEQREGRSFLVGGASVAQRRLVGRRAGRADRQDKRGQREEGPSAN